MIVSRKVKLKSLSPEQLNALDLTADKFKELFNFLSEIAWGMKSPSRFGLHKKAYHLTREKFPELPAQYVITAIGKVSGAIASAKTWERKRKAENKKRLPKGRKLLKDVTRPEMKKSSVVVLDIRLATLKDFSCKVTTAQGRFSYDLEMYPYIQKHWQYRQSGCELVKHNGEWYVAVCFDLPEALQNGEGILGVDRGVNNIAVCSNNKFYNSKKLRKVKGRYQHQKRELQSKGTKSAKRKLKLLRRKENRFVKDVNHCLSKELVNSGFETIALEKLDLRTEKKLGKSFNHKIGNWSWHQLETFITYKAKIAGVKVTSVPSNYTSQICSKCGHTEKKNRKGSTFHCKSCGFELHADLNAARNIASRGKSPESRLPSINQTAGKPANVASRKA